MIIDTSALIAVLADEPEADGIRKLLAAYGGRISAATLVEARMVAYGRAGAEAMRRLDQFVRRYGLETVPFDAEQADAAADAFIAYGRGSGHPARLNYGDTFSYALSHVTDEPLLFVGDDFRRTDLRSALEEYA
ncbi:PIN domain-containing protein [Agrococcus sp. KRD186]|uniref:PIN domain-containing protein n=1 Tax=Agrococcus sp. KRD186 TaxID=2729730 RepID=UPI0019D0CADF